VIFPYRFYAATVVKMKTLTILCFSAFLTYFLSSTAFADTRTVEVRGDAEVLVTPDKATIRTGIEYWDRNLANARKNTEDSLKKVLALVEDFKLGKENMLIERVNVEVERKGWNEKPMHALEGYYVRRNITFVLKDLERFDDFLGRLLDAGINQIHGVDFQTSELRKHRDTARELAMKAAQEKAQLLARSVGQKIGRAIHIKESHDDWFYPYSFYSSRLPQMNALQNVSQDSSGRSSSNGVSGKISIQASVHVNFQLD
jgi:uncharacterized protein YggE